MAGPGSDSGSVTELAAPVAQWPLWLAWSESVQLSLAGVSSHVTSLGSPSPIRDQTLMSLSNHSPSSFIN